MNAGATKSVRDYSIKIVECASLVFPLLHNIVFFFFSSRRRHTSFDCAWSSDVCSSDLRSCCPAGTKLNAYFRFGFQSGLLNFLHHSQPVISRQRDKSARYFDDVEADFFTLRDIAVYGVRPLREDMFDKPTRGYQHMVFVALRNQFFQYISGHQAKRSACELQSVHIGPQDRKSTRLNSSHSQISYAVFCLKKKK